MNNQDLDNKKFAHLLGTGTWLDWLPNIPRPVIAFGRYDIYSVLLNGQDFSLPIGGLNDPAIGFYTTRYVAAENIRDAKKAAFVRVIREWENRGYRALCGKKPTLSTEEVLILKKRFRLRSGTGFTFYNSED